MECRALPVLAARLPWAVFYRFSYWMCRWPWLFNEGADAALEAARAHGLADQPAVWLRRFRWTRLVDHVDASLSTRRGDDWMDRHLQVSGDWPSGPCLAVTFHLGAGLWAIRHLRRRGRPVAFVSAPLPQGEGTRARHERAGLEEVQRIGGSPAIHTGGGFQKICAQLATGTSVVALIDVPEAAARSRQAVQFLGRAARFPSGLIEAARLSQVPLAVFVCFPDSDTGQRRLQITHVDPSCADALQAVIGVLERHLRQASWDWHFWHLTGTFMLPENPGFPFADSRHA